MIQLFFSSQLLMVTYKLLLDFIQISLRYLQRFRPFLIDKREPQNKTHFPRSELCKLFWAALIGKKFSSIDLALTCAFAILLLNVDTRWMVCGYNFQNFSHALGKSWKNSPMCSYMRRIKVWFVGIFAARLLIKKLLCRLNLCKIYLPLNFIKESFAACDMNDFNARQLTTAPFAK